MTIATIKNAVELTEGRIVFLCLLALCMAATFSLISWNPQFSVALTLGFVKLADRLITAYFDNDSDNDLKKKIVFLAAFGYCAIFGVSLWKWNDFVGGSLITGFLFFVDKISSKFFGTPQTEPPTTKIEPQKQVIQG